MALVPLEMMKQYGGGSWKSPFGALGGTGDQRNELAKFMRDQLKAGTVPAMTGPAARFAKPHPTAQAVGLLNQGLQQGLGDPATLQSDTAPWLPQLQGLLGMTQNYRYKQPTKPNAATGSLGPVGANNRFNNIQQLFAEFSKKMGQPDPMTFLLALLKATPGQFRPA